MHMPNSAHEVPNLKHRHLALHFLLQPQVTVYVSGSVTIHLLGRNTESTEFQPNSTRVKLVSGENLFLMPISHLNNFDRHKVI